MLEFVAGGENNNGVLLGDWPKLLMSDHLERLLTLKIFSLDSETDTDTSVALIVIFLWNENSHFL